MLSDGDRWTPVEGVYETGEWEVVYNLRIADFHTYFVTDWDWGFAVWSHNACVAVHHTSNPFALQIVAAGQINSGSYVQPFSADAAGIAAMQAWLHLSPTGARGNDTSFIVDITGVQLGPTGS